VARQFFFILQRDMRARTETPALLHSSEQASKIRRKIVTEHTHRATDEPQLRQSRDFFDAGCPLL